VAVLLIGTLDTKGEEFLFLRARLNQAGVVLADVGTGGPPTVEPDIPRELTREYTASTTATVTSTAADAKLTVSDPAVRPPPGWSTARLRWPSRCRSRATSARGGARGRSGLTKLSVCMTIAVSPSTLACRALPHPSLGRP
jgi:uncharacterized protein (UPF0261 family)